MFSKKKDEKLMKRTDDDGLFEDRLDRLGYDLTLAAQSSDEEIEAAVNAPFLYARIRARINAEQERREAVEVFSWRAMLLNAWRPVTGMALMAIVAAALFLFSAIGGGTGSNLSSGDDFLANGEPGFERIFSGNEPLSNDEVLATIMNPDETDGQR